MVKVTVNAGLAVEAGATLNLNTRLDPDSYTVAQVVLGPAGSGTETEELPLLPDGGTVVLLALRATLSDGSVGSVTVTPHHGSDAGDALEVDGTLLVGHRGVLAALVPGGPRTLELENTGPSAVTVDVMTALDS